jgi:hypothetical protein
MSDTRPAHRHRVNLVGEDLARAMARAVLAGDWAAARALADWLCETQELLAGESAVMPLRYDHTGARGCLHVERGHAGPAFAIEGLKRYISGFEPDFSVDFFPRSWAGRGCYPRDLVAQLLLFSPGHDEPLARAAYRRQRGLALALSPRLARASREDRLALCPGGAVLVPREDDDSDRAG